MGPRVSLSSKLVNPQTSTSPRFQMVRTYGRLCFRGVEESPLELGGSLGKGSCLLGALWLLSLLALAGHFFGRRRNARMRAELCRRSGGSHRLGWAGLDVVAREILAWLGGFFSPKLPAPGHPPPQIEGQHLQLGQDVVWPWLLDRKTEATAKGMLGLPA